MLPQPCYQQIFPFVEAKGRAMPFHSQPEKAARSTSQW